jgi:ATP-binding cassette subfamily F protein 3
MRAKDVLLEAIESFSGTVIFVSHDRYFLEKLATKVLEVKDGAVEIYPGNYAEFMRDREEAEQRVEARSEAQPLPVKTAVALEIPVTAASGTGSANCAVSKDRVRKLNPIKLKQMEDRCAFLEEEVPRLEASIAHTEAALGNYVSAEETQRLSSLLEGLRAQLGSFTEEWEELMMALEEQADLA